MKAIIVLVALFYGSMITAQAQASQEKPKGPVTLYYESLAFEPLRVDAGIGYAYPFGEGAKGGILFYMEPKYEVLNKLAIGIRWEGALLVTRSQVPSGNVNVTVDSKAKMNTSYMVTGDYFFFNSKFRPFAGLGLGAYSVSGTTMQVTTDDGTQDVNVGGRTNFGFMLRTGFDIAHFRFTIEYDFAGKDRIGETYNYLGIAAGLYLGGGKR